MPPPDSTERHGVWLRPRELALRHSGIAVTSIKEKLVYRFDFFFSMIASLMTAILLYYLWAAIYRSSTNIVVPLQSLLTYVVLGQVFNFTRIAQAQRRVMYRITTNIENGNIVFDLLRPADYQAMQFSDSFGMFVAELLLISVPTYLLALLLLGISAPASPLAAIAFASSVIIAYVLAFTLDFLLNIFAFWTFSTQGIMYAKKALIDVLAGSIIPLTLFPDWLQDVAFALPFQAIAYTPLAIYTGLISGPAIARGILVQIVWAILLLVLTRFVWLRALRRLTIQGG